jgi:protein involved in polysaccharide export with SLBB domain
MIKKIVYFLMLSCSSMLFGVEILVEQNVTQESKISMGKQVYFGEKLFQGNFKQNKQYRYNPNYLINVGDVISVKIWGAFDFSEELLVDKQGNIFLPKVGEIHLLGLKNARLKSKIEAAMKRVFNENVYVYADLKQYQPISVFVSGAVHKVGLYEGLSSDSVLQYIDKAGGIIRGDGSFRNVSILRNKQVIKNVDLYSFLMDGQVDTFQFKNGDVVLVNPIQNTIEVSGDVGRPYIFELVNNDTTVRDVIGFIVPKATVNSFILTRWSGDEETTQQYDLNQAQSVRVSNGTRLKFVSNYYVNSIEIELEGEYKGPQNMTVEKGTTLFDVLEKLDFTPLSEIRNVRLYRKSVASIQKQLIETMLQDLEARTFTSDSSTVEEASIRNKESSMILNFVERVRKIEPLGQVILNQEDNLDSIYLEYGDKIVIPKRSNIVIVQGEVNIPNALAYRENYSIDDYVGICGGYGDRANTDKVLLIKGNGEVVQYASGETGSPKVNAGDSILVLGKVDSKNILITSSITQILYQIAVGAAVVLRAF